MTHRIGYACKYRHHDRALRPAALARIEKEFNTRTVTAKWCRDNPQLAKPRIVEVVTHNINSIMRQLSYVASLPADQHMMRISSDILPLYTHRECRHLYISDISFLNMIQTGLKQCGDFARTHDIRVSFHPGQFTVLASENPNVVENSIQEFEYHADLLWWMGYGRSFQDAKCNVHVGGKLGIQGIIDVLPRLSDVARNTITIENDEMSYGLSEVLKLAEHVPIVLDVHHHFINTGEYIQPDSQLVKDVISSWRGVRPTMHYSLSREDVLINHCDITAPDLTNLLNNGYNKQKLRAHSDTAWNHECNRWVAGFIGSFDIMVEAKHKNLASTALAQYVRSL